LVGSVRADFGINVVQWVLYLMDNLVDLRKFQTVAFVLDTVSAITSLMGQWTAYISSWLAPVDEAFTYIHAKLYYIQLLLDPIFRLLARLAAVVGILVEKLRNPLALLLQVRGR